ncbi:MAG: type III pantothenate kinase [Desulfobulbaceae bacterium]|jgi:type III pantothenate kinase|nr:type III pantothenate kinase [Desulfobulbaceae bacterium]
MSSTHTQTTYTFTSAKSMLLTLDIGNSHTVLGFFDNSSQKLLHHFRIKTDHDSTGDEYGLITQGLLNLKNQSLPDITGVIIGSVVPAAKMGWSTFCHEHLNIAPMIIGDANLKTGVAIATDNPSEVGADRIINGLAGFTRHKGPLIIVDFGTAITFDCISQTGAYIGGAIAPGIGISMEALSAKTAKLPKVDISTPPASAIGKNTITAMQAGILFGYGGLVEGLTGRLAREFPTPPLVIATGGMAALIAPYAPVISHVYPELTLEGLQLIHARNT